MSTWIWLFCAIHNALIPQGTFMRRGFSSADSEEISGINLIDKGDLYPREEYFN